jgi:K+-sensing histidine kinase KdpD
VAEQVEEELDEYMHEPDLHGWQAAERVAVLLDNTRASEVVIRRGWRLASAFDGGLIAAYPAYLGREQGMTHILTIAMDLNATLRELPGENIERELGDLIQAENVQHLMLLAQPSRALAGLRRETLHDRIVRRHPHVTIHLVAAGHGV